MKRFIRFLLFACLFCCLIAADAIADTLILPERITVIDAETFMGTAAADEVVLPEGVKRIESRAFAASGVKRIYLPDGLEYIAPDAFDGCLSAVGYGLPGTYAAEYCEAHGIPYEAFSTPLEEFTFTYPNAQEATLTGWSGDSKYVVVPESPDGTHTVTAIAQNVFKGKTNLQYVSLPDSLISLGKSAFDGCGSLRFIKLPRNLQTVGVYAFRNCKNLTDVAFNDHLIALEDGAFMNCTSLLEADLPDSLEKLGVSIYEGVFAGDTALNSFHYPKNLASVNCHSASGLFFGCTSLTSVAIPEGTENLVGNLFRNAISLTSVTLPSTLKTIGAEAFLGCTGLPAIALPDGVYEIGVNAFVGCTGLTELVLPADLETLCRFAFRGCVNIADVAFNDGLTVIEDGAFMNCTSLLEADLPDSVEKLGVSIYEGVFAGDTALHFFHYPKNLTSVKCHSASGLFFGCTSLTSVTIPEGTENLVGNLFRNAVSLTSVTLPTTLETIGSNAFLGCINLPAISLPDGVYEIGMNAFEGCAGLTELVLPADLETLRRFAFRGCVNIADVAFNDGLTVIEDGAFMNCTSLLEADLPDSVEKLGVSIYEGVFAGDTALHFFHYPKNLTSVSCHSASGLFFGCKSLTAIAIPEGTENLVGNLCRNAVSLTSVTLPSTLKTIGGEAFLGCTGLPEITFPNSLLEIGNGAFEGCTGFTAVVLSANLKTVGKDAFKNCANVVDVVFNEGLVTLADGAFMNCTSLLEADMPDSLENLGTSIFNGVFAGDTALTSFHYPASLKSVKRNITNGPFMGTAIAEAVIPEGVETLFSGLFYGMPKLTNVSLPSTLRVIEGDAFRASTALREIDLPVGVTTLGNACFRDCSALRRIYIPETVTAIGNDSFSGTHHKFEIWTEYGAYAVTYAQKNSHNYYYLSLVGCNYPKTVVYQGEGYTMYGSVESTVAITSVTSVLTNVGTGEKLVDYSAAPRTDSFDLGELNGLLNLSARPLGTYSLNLSAVTAKSEETFFSVTFQVKEPPLRLDLSDTSIPGKYVHLQELYNMQGTLRANYPLSAVSAVLTNTDTGAIKSSYSAAPGEKSLSLDAVAQALGYFTETGNYHIRMTVTGHGETKTVVDRALICTQTVDVTVPKPDPLFSGTVSMDTVAMPKLAFWSAELAVAAYSDGSYIAKSCGFRNCEKRGSESLIRYVLMWKDIVNPDFTQTRLWCIGVQGTKGIDQWLSNFTVGSGTYHAGFLEAANAVYEGFLSYKNRIDAQYPRTNSGKITDKVWIAGHSRGAAAANILGGDLLKKAGFNQNTIFAFCFACPRIKTGGNTAAKQVRVYNISGDLVPTVPFDEWGWKNGWYGKVETCTDEYVGGGEHLRTYHVATSGVLEPLRSTLQSLVKGKTDLLRTLLANALHDTNVDNTVNLLLGVLHTIKSNGAQFDFKDNAEAATVLAELLSIPFDDDNVLSRIGGTHDMDVYRTWMASRYSNFAYDDYTLD